MIPAFERTALEPSSWLWLSLAAIASIIFIALGQMRSPQVPEALPAWGQWCLRIQFAGFLLLAVSAVIAWLGYPSATVDIAFDAAFSTVGIGLFVGAIGAVLTVRRSRRE